MRALLLSTLILALVAVSPVAAGRNDEPEQVTVQHILIGFGRKVQGKKIDRTKKEAKELAASLLKRAEAGEDFDAMVKEFTDDSYPGMYTLVNKGVAAVPAGAYKRDDMAYMFGDVAFGLQVGEVGMTNFHAGGSPYGYHVIKRIE